MEFVLSDESVNRYGSRVITEGISLTGFAKNPVMLYQHERGNVIGKWENLRKENGVLYGTAVFGVDELAKEIESKVKSGILSACSISFKAKKEDIFTDSEGVEVISKCDLLEVSIVDVPANANAVKTETEFAGELVYKLCFENAKPENDPINVLRSLVNLLGCQPDERSILNAVKVLKNGGLKVGGEVQTLYDVGGITKGEMVEMLDLRERDGVLYKKLFKTFQNAHDEKANAYKEEIKQALFYGVENSNHGTQQACFVIDRILDKTHIKDLEILANGLPKDKVFSFATAINKGKGIAQKRSGLDVEKNLDWYRKNNPEYLKENPDFYRDLISREKKLKECKESRYFAGYGLSKEV